MMTPSAPITENKKPIDFNPVQAQENLISVCGVVVYVHPDRRTATEARMREIPGLEIHGRSEDGKLVVTIETSSYKATGEAISQLQQVQGILSVSLIYQHAEPLNDEADRNTAPGTTLLES